VPKASFNDDFGVITSTKQKAAEDFANSEVKAIVREDVQKVMASDSQKKDPFDNDIDKLYAELGI
jgi:hypothetical protein